MAWIDDLKTALSFLVFGTGAVFIITMDIATKSTQHQLNTTQSHTFISAPDNVSAPGGVTEPICSQPQRRRHLLQVCAQRGWGHTEAPRALHGLYYDDVTKIVFCGTPWEGYESDGMLKLDSLPNVEREQRLKDYRKVVVVGHPLTHVALLHQLTNGNDSDFQSWVTIIQSEKNIFMTSYYEQCQPCDVSYDHVIRLETLVEERPLVRRLFGDKMADYIVTNYRSNIRKFRGSQIRNVWEQLLAMEAESMLSKDLELFGYAVGNGAVLRCGVQLNTENTTCC